MVTSFFKFQGIKIRDFQQNESTVDNFIGIKSLRPKA